MLLLLLNRIWDSSFMVSVAPGLFSVTMREEVLAAPYTARQNGPLAAPRQKAHPVPPCPCSEEGPRAPSMRAFTVQIVNKVKPGYTLHVSVVNPSSVSCDTDANASGTSHDHLISNV